MDINTKEFKISIVKCIVNDDPDAFLKLHGDCSYSSKPYMTYLAKFVATHGGIKIMSIVYDKIEKFSSKNDILSSCIEKSIDHDNTKILRWLCSKEKEALKINENHLISALKNKKYDLYYELVELCDISFTKEILHNSI